MSLFSVPAQAVERISEVQLSLNKLGDIEFSPDDICKVINFETISPNVSAGPDGIGAKMLKECCTFLAFPIYKVWRTSLDESKIPAMMKLAEIKPIHKSESKTLAKNYRQVSQTPHIIKFFERIMKERKKERNLLIKSIYTIEIIQNKAMTDTIVDFLEKITSYKAFSMASDLGDCV